MTDTHANLASNCQAQPLPPPQDRRAGRLSTTGLTCSVGKVINISRDGMLVQARTAPQGIISVEITDRNTTLYVTAEVVWTKRVGLFKKQMGLRFIDVPSDVASKLTRIAQARSRQSYV
jgi:hypothetical protein